MNADIYYFSGTGNSFVVARDIAGRLNGKLISIASFINESVIHTDADTIGIVYPVYYADLPFIVRRFCEKLDGISDKYIFAVCTYGGAAGISLKSLSKCITDSGGVLWAKYGVHMPQNAFRKPWEDYDRLYMKWRSKLDNLKENTEVRKKGLFLDNYILNLMFIPFSRFFIRMTRNMLKKYPGASHDMTMEQLVHNADTGFKTDENCNGCGICANICPVSNITIENGRPVWLHHCQNCLACYNWCPVKAVKGGIAQQGYYYRCASAGVSDISGRKKSK